MRVVPLLLLFLASIACTDPRDPIPPPPGEEECQIDCPPEPVIPDPIDLGDDIRMAAGTTVTRLRPLATPTLVGAILTPRDPAIASARVIGEHEFEIVAHAPGTVILDARRFGSDLVLDTLEVTAVPVDSVEVFVRAAPGADEPVAAFAGVRGSHDMICTRYLAVDGEVLPGTGTFTPSTDAVRAGEVDVLARPSEAFAHRSTCVRLHFLRAGIAELVAGVEGGPSHTVAVEVVEATAATTATLSFMVLRDNEIVPAPDPVVVEELVGVDLLVRTADGRLVTGVVPAWTVTSPGDVFYEAGDELVFTVDVPGTVEVTATAGGLVATGTITAAR